MVTCQLDSQMSTACDVTAELLHCIIAYRCFDSRSLSCDWEIYRKLTVTCQLRIWSPSPGPYIGLLECFQSINRGRKPSPLLVLPLLLLFGGPGMNERGQTDVSFQGASALQRGITASYNYFMFALRSRRPALVL